MAQQTVSAAGTASSDDGLRTGEVARELGVSETRVRQLAAAGILEARVTSLGRLYSAESVERYKNRDRRPGRPTKEKPC